MGTMNLMCRSDLNAAVLFVMVYFPSVVVLLSPFDATYSAYLPFDCSKWIVFIDKGGEHCALEAQVCWFLFKTALDEVTDYTNFYQLNQPYMT